MTTESYNCWNIGLQIQTVLSVLITVVVYYRQLQAMQKGATAQNILTLVQYLQAPELRAARRHVLSRLQSMAYDTWNDEDKSLASNDVRCLRHRCGADIPAEVSPGSSIRQQLGLQHRPLLRNVQEPHRSYAET